MAKRNKEKEESILKQEQIDILANDVLEIINRKFKEKDLPDAAGYMSNANLVTNWCPTGCDILDLAISNRPYGGLGFGTIVEMTGLEGSGKSLLAAHILTECQKKGGLAVLFDTEKALGMLDFYCSVGLDPNKVIYSDRLRALEEVYEAMELIIKKALLIDKNRPVTIVVDSVMGASTLAELESDFEKDGYATSKAIVNSKAMRKIPSLIAGKNILIILINQLRDAVGAIGFGADKYQTSGGKAIGFTASTRLRLKRIGQLKGKINGIDSIIGESIEVAIIKNRLGPPKRKVKFDIRYDSGIDNYGSWLTMLKELGGIGQSGSSYSYKYVDGDTGEEVTKKFQSKDFKKLIEETPGLKDVIYEQICEAYIMKYDLGEEELGIDDIELVTEEDELD